METDYSTLTRDEFEKEVKKYIVFRLLNNESVEESCDAEQTAK
jgi:hypothetical protein